MFFRSFYNFDFGTILRTFFLWDFLRDPSGSREYDVVELEYNIIIYNFILICIFSLFFWSPMVSIKPSCVSLYLSENLVMIWTLSSPEIPNTYRIICLYHWLHLPLQLKCFGYRDCNYVTTLHKCYIALPIQ